MKVSFSLWLTLLMITLLSSPVLASQAPFDSLRLERKAQHLQARGNDHDAVRGLYARGLARHPISSSGQANEQDHVLSRQKRSIAHDSIEKSPFGTKPNLANAFLQSSTSHPADNRLR